jgi:hypothetical protein
MTVKQPAITMEEVSDSIELHKAQAPDARFARNWAWCEAHTTESYAAHRGKCICVAGAELFVAGTPAEVLALAIAARPHDNGRLTRLIPQDKMARIYADQWHVACVR